MNFPKITYCMVHLNRIDELKRSIRLYSPYVDRIIISDGESTDGSLEWLRSKEALDLKVETIVKKQYRFPYGNHTPDARNPYLEAAGTDGWILVTDSDEYIQKEGLENLRNLIIKAEEKGVNEIRFQAHDIWSYENGEIYDNRSSYWKEWMFFKASPGMKYVGHTHSGLYRPGVVNRWAKSGYEYTHEKTERRICQNSTFLWWTTSKEVDNKTDSPEWIEFHNIMSKYGYKDWHDVDKAMLKGNLPQEIKDWFIANKESENSDAASWFIWYFIFLHPEENLNKLSCERHPRYTWNYLGDKKDVYFWI